jgi:hypothetical protein
MDDSVEPMEQKGGREARIVDRPCAGGGAGFEQPGKVDNNDVVTGLLGRARLIFVKDDIVERRPVEVAGNSGLGPRGKLSFPILLGPLADGYFKTAQEIAHKAFTQRQENIVLGCKMKIEGTLGDVGAVGDLLDGGRPHAVLKEKTLGGVHQFVAPLFGRLGPWTAESHVRIYANNKRCSVTQFSIEAGWKSRSCGDGLNGRDRNQLASSG